MRILLFAVLHPIYFLHCKLSEYAWFKGSPTLEQVTCTFSAVLPCLTIKQLSYWVLSTPRVLLVARLGPRSV
jgi:hypothetical protein